MSDRYRPPTGPKSTRGFKNDKKFNSKPGGSFKSSFNGRPAPPNNRYSERDNYRPKIHGPLAGNDDSSTPPARPTGPSSFRSGGGNKRSFPGDSKGYRQPPEKRRNVSLSYKPKGQGPSSASNKVDLSNLPKGPRSKQNRDYKHPGGPPAVAPPRGPGGKRIDNEKPQQPSAPVAPRKLTRNQTYLIQITRGSEVYQRIQQVGEGTYGKVYKAKNSITNEYVALKKLRLESEREGFPITAMREIKLLQSFDHRNIVGLLEMMIEHNQVYMTLDYLDHDLAGILTHPDLKLEESHRKFLFKQLMEGINYLHGKRVIHRDIKGSNILLDNNGVLKIADFGLARTMKILNTGETPDYTNRVITIWYRPPELLLGATDYGREVDIWGVGCLLVELYSKVATFQGTEEVSQLYKIFDLMGTPTIASWPLIENLPWFEMLKPKINKNSRFEKEYKQMMSPQSFDLAEKLLTLNPATRLTAEQALQHPYFTEDPQPAPIEFLKTVKGEWHEFETKKRRRQERKKMQDAQKAAAAAESNDNDKTASEVASDNTPMPDAVPASVS